MFSNEQLIEFRNHGFFKINNLLSPHNLRLALKEVRRLQNLCKDMEYSTNDFNIEAPSGGFYSKSGNIKGYKGKLRAIVNLHNNSPFFSNILLKNKLKEKMCDALFGCLNLKLLTSILWCKPAKVGSCQPWHQDPASGSDELKRNLSKGFILWIALEDATIENGCLQFIPASHTRGILEFAGSTDPSEKNQQHIKVDELFKGIDPVPVELQAGDAVCFDIFSVHSSGKNVSNRSRTGISFCYGLMSDNYLPTEHNHLIANPNKN